MLNRVDYSHDVNFDLRCTA